MNVKHQMACALSTLLLAGGVAVTPVLWAQETPLSPESAMRTKGGTQLADSRGGELERQEIEKIVEETVGKSPGLKVLLQSQINDSLLNAVVSLNALLLAFLGLFIAVGMLLLWWQREKLFAQTEIHKQELESYQADSINEIKRTIYEAETVLDRLGEQADRTEKEIVSAKNNAAAELRSIAAETQAARDQIYKKLAEFLPRLTQGSAASEKQMPTAADYVKQGDAMFMEKGYEEAIGLYDRAIALQPDLPEAWNNRGGALAKLQRYQEAIASYDKALSIKADFPEAWNNKAGALAKLQRYQEALKSYDRALSLKQSDPLIWLNLGNVLGKLQQYKKAIAAYDKTIELGANEPLIWYNRGNALTKLRSYEEAVKSYDRLLSIKPDDAEGWYGRGYALYELQRYQEALASYDKSLEIQPEKADTWNNRGNVLEKLQEYNQAINSYEKALSIQSKKYEAWDNRGYTLARLGRYQEAIASLERSLQIKPDHANAYYNRAYCYGAMGNIKSALLNLQRAIKLNPAYREAAKTDPDLATIREYKAFKQLVGETHKLVGIS